MSFLHHQFWPVSPVIPARTPAASPVITPWPVTQGHCYDFRLTIPAGHHGLTGFKVTYFGQQIVPWSLNAWYTVPGNNQVFEWDQEIMAAGLALAAYNTDIVAHQFFGYANVVPVLGTAPGSFTATDTAGGATTATLAAIGALSG